MHYKDGTPVFLGDIVKGKGFNLPHEIIGPVSKIIPDQGTCNIRIGTIISKFHPHMHEDGAQDRPEHFTYEAYEEAGTAVDFELLHRHGWKHKEIITKRMEWVKE